ncbi:wax ester synthase/diacylglycerol acyltransferase 5-like isoform X2 [Solanum dulcamara]|uniref:wax ester synthase/diacylglycerol acyltransferase 5-like isoform X2 n=1 Tax=Solanum dulcamara TaxID=45834 RepID=UPI002486B04A|nr:wax ester synthase/diacylglycerol acyltransferase 5-like isoform X2 [Solanum dulcamara]
MGSLGLRPIDTMTKIGQKNSTVVVIEQEQEQEPASPATRLFHTKTLNCHIIAILGCTTKINRDVIKKGLESTLINHPRFSSVPVVDEKKGVRKWMKTTINVEEHIVCPNLDPDMDSPDEFLENYTSNLTTIPLDLTKPLWEDTETPMKGGAGVEHSPKRLVHVTISLDDMKIVKNALSMTINDVVMGMAQAGFSRYLNRRYGKKNGKGSSKTNNLPKNIRLRGSIVFNIRPSTGIKALAEMMEKKSKAKWGNKIGYVLTRIPISLPDNPLDYIRQAKTIIDRKKLSLESRFSFSTAKLTQDIFGSKVAAKVTRRVLSSTTVLISNVVGPQEEITFFGHKLAYVAPTTFGLPYAVTIHFQSYCNKMTISMSVDPEVIPDPYQLLDDLQDSLQMFKEVVTKQDTIGV